jgi:hypothetical protein
MARYVYGYRLVEDGDEVFFEFPKFPEIISSLSAREYGRISPEALKEFLLDAIVVALQATMTLREDIPDSDSPQVTCLDGFVSLPVHQAMKLELYRLCKANGFSAAALARRLEKSETIARRLLDLRHKSLPSEVEGAIAALGKELVHNWTLELSARNPPLSQRQQPEAEPDDGG